MQIELSTEQRAALERIGRLGSGATIVNTDGSMPENVTAEEVLQAHIDSLLDTYTEQLRTEQVGQVRALGEVMVKLPTEDQQALVSDLVARAQAAGIDTSKITGG